MINFDIQIKIYYSFIKYFKYFAVVIIATTWRVLRVEYIFRYNLNYIFFTLIFL